MGARGENTSSNFVLTPSCDLLRLVYHPLEGSSCGGACENTRVGASGDSRTLTKGVRTLGPTREIFAWCVRWLANSRPSRQVVHHWTADMRVEL